MIKIVRTDAGNVDFVDLVRQLDADLAERDGSEHSYYAQFNKLDDIKHVLIAYDDGRPVSCGAIRPLGDGQMEVKRMFTLPHSRGYGIGAAILEELESWAAELGASSCVLETGKRQPEAIRLYERSGYTVIPNYGQYVGMENSVCFEKVLAT